MIQEKTVKSACSPYCHLYIQLVDFSVRIIIYDNHLFTELFFKSMLKCASQRQKNKTDKS